MTSNGRITACPQCGENTPPKTYTELVHTCRASWEVAEWSECGRCHRWLAFHIRKREE
ncbi:hypothetical protein GCM10010313_82810 [Streptomyces violarus]|uniref:Uncharacterized protein n=1 Tax=Streptomyces violarus TaxID=67380 RepID=A0A7W4ZZP5_9ACTN|nr:hypothetical protein [Streptomyces violarus]GHD35456.1 hypothetical protein GCM10010313_82810 [Streptomyces violarus]